VLYQHRCQVSDQRSNKHKIICKQLSISTRVPLYINKTSTERLINKVVMPSADLRTFVTHPISGQSQCCLTGKFTNWPKQKGIPIGADLSLPESHNA
jgi:hypothetical protein